MIYIMISQPPVFAAVFNRQLRKLPVQEMTPPMRAILEPKASHRKSLGKWVNCFLTIFNQQKMSFNPQKMSFNPQKMDENESICS